MRSSTQAPLIRPRDYRWVSQVGPASVSGYGPEANLEMTWVGTIRKGKIYGLEFFWNHAEALEAVGLAESDPGSS